MKNRTFLIAYVNAELKARMNIHRFEQEFHDVSNNPNQSQGAPNQPAGNNPSQQTVQPVQQPQYSG